VVSMRYFIKVTVFLALPLGGADSSDKEGRRTGHSCFKNAEQKRRHEFLEIIEEASRQRPLKIVTDKLRSYSACETGD